MIKDGYSSVSLLSFSCYFTFQLCNLFYSCYLILFYFTICCHITHITHIHIFRKNNCLNGKSALNLKVFVPQKPMQITPQFSVFSFVESGHNWIIIDFSSSFVRLFPLGKISVKHSIIAINSRPFTEGIDKCRVEDELNYLSGNSDIGAEHL